MKSKKLFLKRCRNLGKFGKIAVVTLGVIVTTTIQAISFASDNHLSLSGFVVMENHDSAVNLRSGPSTNYKSIAKLKYQEPLTILDQDGEWYKVRYRDIEGYIYWKYLDFVELEPQAVDDDTLSATNKIEVGNSIIHYKSSENRDYNMALSSSVINTYTLEPGETFKWSEVVGDGSKESGYKESIVISGGKYVKGFGGGNCQVSTALYNAILDTTIIPDEVHEHSKVDGKGCEYAEHDATVAYGYKDFVFTNTYKFPLTIEAYTYKGVVFVNLYLTTPYDLNNLPFKK